jgi:hypothetical protein
MLKKLYKEEFHNFLSPNNIRMIRWRKIRWMCMKHAWGIRKAWRIVEENLKGKDFSGDVIMDGRVWAGFVWLRLGTSGRLLWTKKLTTGCHKWPGICWLMRVLAFQGGFCYLTLHFLEENISVADDKQVWVSILIF